MVKKEKIVKKAHNQLKSLEGKVIEKLIISSNSSLCIKTKDGKEYIFYSSLGYYKNNDSTYSKSQYLVNCSGEIIDFQDISEYRKKIRYKQD